MSTSAEYRQLTLFDLESSLQKRCTAINSSNGKRCSRMAKPGSDVCPHHLPGAHRGGGYLFIGKKFDNVQAYLDSISIQRKERFYDKREMLRIANACGLSVENARAELKKCGYVKTTNTRGISYWVLENDL